MLGVGAGDATYAGANVEISDLSQTETGDRDETTHSEDEFHIVTPAPLTASAIAAGVVVADPTVTQTSKSDWTLDEHSVSTMKFTVQAAESVGTDNYTTDIEFGSINNADTDGAYGDSSLDVAADGTRTTGKAVGCRRRRGNGRASR